MAALAALHVPTTGVIDYVAVCAALVRRLESAGALLRTGVEVHGSHRSGGSPGPAHQRRRPARRPRRRLRRAARRRAGSPAGPPAVRAHRALPWRVLLADDVGGATRARPGLPRARPASAVPRGPPHSRRRRPRARRSQRRAGPGPRGLPLAGRRPARAARHRGLPGHVAAGPAALTAPGCARSRARCRATGSGTACDGWSPSCATTTWCRLRPACVRRRYGVTGASSTTSSSSGSGQAVHVLNAPSPAATSAFEIAAHVVGLLGESTRRRS